MSKITERLAELNVVRAINDKPAVSNWKKSIALLDEAIAKERAAEDFDKRVAQKEIIAAAVEENKAANERIARLEASAKNKPMKFKKVLEGEVLPNIHAKSNSIIAAAIKADPSIIAPKKKTIDIKPIAKAEIAALENHNKAQMKKAGLKKETSPKVKAAVKKLAAKAGHKSSKVEGTINVSEIAKELGVNPKVARATLRRKNVDRTDEAAVRAALTK